MEIFITQPFDNKMNLHHFREFKNATEFVLHEMQKDTQLKNNKIVDYIIKQIDETHWCGVYIMENPVIIDKPDLKYDSHELWYYPIVKKETED